MIGVLCSHTVRKTDTTRMATTNLKCSECGYEAKTEEDRQKHMQEKHAAGAEGSQRQNRQEREETGE